MNVTVFIYILYINRNIGKRTVLYVRPMKTQISVRIRAVWSESSLSTWWNFAAMAIQNAQNENSERSHIQWIWLCPEFMTSRSEYVFAQNFHSAKSYINVLQKISPPKTENFQIKTSEIFFIFLLKT